MKNVLHLIFPAVPLDVFINFNSTLHKDKNNNVKSPNLLQLISINVNFAFVYPMLLLRNIMWLLAFRMQMMIINLEAKSIVAIKVFMLLSRPIVEFIFSGY